MVYVDEALAKRAIPRGKIEAANNAGVAVMLNARLSGARVALVSVHRNGATCTLEVLSRSWNFLRCDNGRLTTLFKQPAPELFQQRGRQRRYVDA